jgi:hypothetical protein
MVRGHTMDSFNLTYTLCRKSQEGLSHLTHVRLQAAKWNGRYVEALETQVKRYDELLKQVCPILFMSAPISL